LIFHRSNYDDIKRYYANTIIKLPQLSGDRLWQIVSISPEEVKLVDVDGMEIYIDLNEEYEVEYPLPGRVVYQRHDGRAGLIHRRPAKQYYRGLHKENTSLSCYTKDGGLAGLSWGIDTLQEFVDKPCYQDPNTIDLTAGYSWAISPYMAVTQSGLIMVLTQPVAVIESMALKEIKMLKPLFHKEVQTSFKGWQVQ
jgi:hypothetical protein